MAGLLRNGAWLALVLASGRQGGRPLAPQGQSTASAGLEDRPESTRVVELPELGLTLTLPALEGLRPGAQGRWSGSLGASRVEIALDTLASERFEFGEPDEVLLLGPSHWRDPALEPAGPVTRHALSGPYGFAAYASTERSLLRSLESGAAGALRLRLAGLLPEQGYWITIQASPPPTAEEEARLAEFLAQGIAYAGPVREHRWTEAEAEQRWRRDVPEALRAKLQKPVRTEHYIVLTSSSAGAAFGRRLEECHAAVLRTYPFDDVPERRLLPVLLFRTQEEYASFLATLPARPPEGAARARGLAWRDAYVTFDDAPGDPVHLHETTHQLFANRLHLGGGGAWFQEGVAEYLSSKPGERAAAAARARKQRHVPLAEFVALASLDSSDEALARERLAQAALLIEFLRESPWARAAFPAFLESMGRSGRGELHAVEGVFREVYGVDLDGLERRWLEYCRAR